MPFKHYTLTRDYVKSNRITGIDFLVPNEARYFATKLLHSSDYRAREALGEKLLQTLSKSATIAQVNLKVSHARQRHKRRSGRTVFKQYGYYRARSQYIYIANYTAIRGKALAPKTFLDTLLHEWMHHYDTQALGIRSYHTKGFYTRLSSLRMKLA